VQSKSVLAGLAVVVLLGLVGTVLVIGDLTSVIAQPPRETPTSTSLPAETPTSTGTSTAAPIATPSGAAATGPAESSPVPPQEARPMTVAEVREALEAYAREWRTGAVVTTLVSIDHPEDSTSSGLDGRRRAWQATIVDSTPPGTELYVDVVDGSIVPGTEGPRTGAGGMLTGQLALDSPEALTLATEAKPDFTPALPGGKGVHFSLERRQNGTLAINLRGARGPYPAMVSLDATTGEVLAAQFQTYGWGGILYSWDGGETWDGVGLPGSPKVAPDPLMEDKAYAATTEEFHIAVYQTEDGGAGWTPVGTLPDDAGHWPFALEAIAATSQETHLLVGTWSGLWSSPDGREWSLVPGLPEGPKQWLAAVQGEGDYRLLVSITYGDDSGLYASTDLLNWEKLDDDAYRLSESFDRRIVLATCDGGPNRALLLSIEGESEMKMPEPVLAAAGDFTGSAPMIINGLRSGLGRRLGEAVDWTGPGVGVASVAAAPDFATSGLAILGGFRSGIYRSTDGGQNWQPVVANPSAIVPGNNEISAVEFLSPTTVVAVHGAPFTWQDF
jgi:photosystem II stability/assembly factor-like uncharacterized protein